MARTSRSLCFQSFSAAPNEIQWQNPNMTAMENCASIMESDPERHEQSFSEHDDIYYRHSLGEDAPRLFKPSGRSEIELLYTTNQSIGMIMVAYRLLKTNVSLTEHCGR